MKNNGESQHVKQPVEEKVFYDHENGIWHAVLHLKLFKQHFTNYIIIITFKMY